MRLAIRQAPWSRFAAYILCGGFTVRCEQGGGSMTIDLRSDTATKPTTAVLEDMIQANVGDAAIGECPATTHLEQRTAALLGKLVRAADTVSVCFSKGLGAPMVRHIGINSQYIV